jgi:hypothetical protein
MAQKYTLQIAFVIAGYLSCLDIDILNIQEEEEAEASTILS